MKYKIIDIKDIKTLKTRTDGRYPLRIGSIVTLLNPNLKYNDCAFLEYIKDNQGNPKEGVLRTSIVHMIEIDGLDTILHTHNSIYYLKAIED